MIEACNPGDPAGQARQRPGAQQGRLSVGMSRIQHSPPDARTPPQPASASSCHGDTVEASRPGRIMQPGHGES
jgi:hypothetical protein